VTTGEARPAAALGFEALARADWEGARRALTEALEAGDESPEVLDALGRALWWLRDARGAVVHRERAYAGFRREGRLARAARIALWLSREYELVWRNRAAANGWIARAERLLTQVAPGAERGWLALARAEAAADGAAGAALAAEALDVGVAAGDGDLELRALAQLGLSEVSMGRVDAGLTRLDEAMAAATSGEPATLETFADVCCTLMLACELAGDEERPRQWSRVFEGFAREHDHVPLLAFCRTCCADVEAANGRVDAAEVELLAALRELTEAGQQARCVHPATRLAEIRVLQGRLDEAERLLAGFEGAPEAVRAAVALRLARDRPAAAVATLDARLEQVGRDNPLAVPLLALLVEAALAAGAGEEAAAAARQLEAIAEGGRAGALALLARGRVAAAQGDPEAPAVLRSAADRLAGEGLALEAARARADLARALAATAPEPTIDAARRARDELEAMGARREADAAAALLRELGARGRTGPRDAALLSRREVEVLRLLGEGLSNARIAARLFISPKTAEHHVSRIYAKLGLAGRAEAVAYALRALGPE
jgi:DNA-binding CsgD family transcriptional regulator